MADLSKVHRTADGRLLAAGWQAGVCGNCPHLHIDLEDPAGNIFATVVIHVESLPALMKELQRVISGLN